MTGGSATGAVVVYGAGGHARVAVDVLKAAGWNVVACIGGSRYDSIDGVPVVDDDEGLRVVRREGVRFAHVAIGDNAVRQSVASAATESGLELATAVSPRAYVAADVELGAGSLVVHGAIVNAGSRIGSGAIVNTGATVDHDNLIGAFAHVAPGCHLAGTVSVGDRAFVGIGTSVIPEISIGADAVVGAGSVVVRNLEDGTRAWGSPARERNKGES